MRKVISVLLAIAITASLCMTAFAASVTTVTNYCATCGKDTQQYKYVDESLNRVVVCPDHGTHDAEQIYIHTSYECFKCGEIEDGGSVIDYNCLF